MNANSVLDADFTLEAGKTEVEVVSTSKYVLLSFLTLGLYCVWWQYKAWKFFKEKENLDIMPAWRAIFSIFFLYSLMEKIQHYASRTGYTKTFSSAGLLVLYIVLSLLGRLPEPYWIISIASIFCLVPAVNAYNYFLENSDAYHAKSESGFNTRQIFLIVLGIIWWVLLAVGLLVGDLEQY